MPFKDAMASGVSKKRSSAAVESERDRADKKQTPGWVSTALSNYPHIKISDDFTEFKCSCDATKWLKTSGSGSNIIKHVSACKTRESQNSQARISATGGLVEPKAKVTQEGVNKRLLAATLSAAMPFAWVENTEVRDLFDYILRAVPVPPSTLQLTLLHRTALASRLSAEYEVVRKAVTESVRSALSPISITFDGGADRQQRPYIAITAHYFDADCRLRAPLVGFLNVPKADEGHTAERIRDVVVVVLADVVGPSYKTKVKYAVTDNGANIAKASVLLGENGGVAVARRCLQHNLQLFIKHVCEEVRSISTPMASANYLAKLCGLSSRFRERVGAIPAAVVTRWGSKLKTAGKVVELRDNIIKYHTDLEPRHQQAPLLEPHLRHLRSHGGFDSLRDVCVVMQPFRDVLLQLEGEKNVTMSRATVQLQGAVDHVNAIFSAAAVGDNSNGLVADTGRVNAWAPLIQQHMETYVSGFLLDDLMLTAMFLDYRNKCGKGLPDDKIRRAAGAVKDRIAAAREELIEADRAVRASQAPVLQNQNAASNDNDDDDMAFLVDLGVAERAAPVQLQQRAADPAPEIVLPTVEDEFKALLAALKEEARRSDALQMQLQARERDSLDVDPISLYNNNKYKLPLARKVALEVLSVPVGEAPAERIFSFSARTMTTSRASMSTTTLTQSTFVVKNKLALNLK